MAGPVLSFVVPVRNDARRLQQCLDSIRRAAGTETVEVIVADNGSSDESPDVAHRCGARTLELPNRRVSQVRNEAAAVATADLIAFVDADHTIDSHWVEAATEVMKDSSVAAAGAHYVAPPDGTWVQRAYDLLRRRAPEPEFTDWLGSGNLVVRRSRFEQVGGFDTSLESCEDVDLCRKLRATGGRILATDAMRSVHHGDPRSLRALFVAELWRGRDNLRVSLREPLTFKKALGLSVPFVYLFALGLLVVGLATNLAAAVLAALAVTALACLRGALMLGQVDRVSPGLLLQTLLVAAVYDAARALALVVRAGHDARRRFER